MNMNNEVESHIYKRYNIKTRIGVGAYGIVWKAVDRKTGDQVAVKKIFDAFKNETDAQRTFREIAFLQEFSEHPNIIQLINVRQAENNRDIYLIFELMESDLHNIIKRGNLLQTVHKQFIIYQILKALKYMHSGNVIHRDLKPSNILLDSNCIVKLCDFGLTRSLRQLENGRQQHILSMDSGNPALTEYVATRWYRAPEILLGSTRYSKSVDLWSLGCIVAEILLGRPLFTGSSSLNQIEKIVSALPRLTQDDIASIKSDYSQSILSHLIYKPGNKLEHIFPTTVDPAAFNLMTSLLQFNPHKRLVVDEALEHDYVEPFHDIDQEIVIDHEIIPPISDETQLTIDEYRQKLYDMITQKKQERLNRKKSKELTRNSTQPQNSNNINPKQNTNASTNSSTNYQPTNPSHCIDNVTTNHESRYETNKYDNKNAHFADNNLSHMKAGRKVISDVEQSKSSIVAAKQAGMKLDNTRQSLKSQPILYDTGNGINQTRFVASTKPHPSSPNQQPRNRLSQTSASVQRPPAYSTVNYSKESSNPVILRDVRSPNHQMSTSGNKVQIRNRPQSSGMPQRSNSASCGRRQFDYNKNVSVVQNPAMFGSYSQKYGTMSNSKLQNIYSKNCVR